MNQLTNAQAQALAVREVMAERLAEMAADLVPEDDPGYMEALERWKAAAPVEIPEGKITLLMYSHEPPIAYIREPEGGEQMTNKDPIEYVTKIDPKLTPPSGRIALSSPKPEKEAEAS